MKPNLLPDPSVVATAPYLEALLSELGGREWTYLMYKEAQEADSIFVWSLLVPESHLEATLGHVGWPIIAGQGNPSCSSTYRDGETVYQYEPIGSGSGIEPLLFKIEHNHDLFDEPWEFSQSARLLLGLWKEKEGLFYSISDTAEPSIEVEVTDEFARIKTKTLLKLLALRQINLVQLIDLRVEVDEDTMLVSNEVLHEDKNCKAELFSSESSPWTPRTQTLSAKKIIRAPEISEEYFMDSETDTPDLEFVIGLDEMGREVTSPIRPTKDSESSSHIGYLRPVFFKRDVLTRYANKSETYEFRNGHLWCGYLWSIPIDQEYDDVVMVWLGDLSRLPASELFHWRGANVAYAGRVSQNTLKRDLLAQFVDDTTTLEALVKARDLLNKDWKTKFGLALFSNLSDEDQRRVSMLNFPTTTTIEAIHQQVVNLYLLLIEPLNEGAMTFEKDTKAGSINRLEFHLSSETSLDVTRILQPWRELNRLRNKIGSHRIGSDGKKHLDEIRSNRGTKVFFEALATELLDSVMEISRSLNGTS
jgi:hypothetical protein